jgi:hypothetical protein
MSTKMAQITSIGFGLLRPMCYMRGIKCVESERSIVNLHVHLHFHLALPSQYGSQSRSLLKR